MSSEVFVKKIVSILLALLLLGCASRGNLKPQVYRDPNISGIKTAFHIPELGVRSTVEVGENLYSKAYYYPSNTYEVQVDRNMVLSESKDRQYGWLLLSVIGAGVTDLTDDTSGENITQRNAHLLSFLPDYNYKMLCGNDNTCLVDKDDSGVFTDKLTFPDNQLTPLDGNIPYTLKRTSPRISHGDFKYEALYQGKIGNKIKVSFREFKNDIARPAFTQDIEYQLDNSGKTTIGFKGLRIIVHYATNLMIDYTVVQDYKSI